MGAGLTMGHVGMKGLSCMAGAQGEREERRGEGGGGMPAAGSGMGFFRPHPLVLSTDSHVTQCKGFQTGSSLLLSLEKLEV